MAVQFLSRCGALALLALVAACGTGGNASERKDECRWNRSSCMYEGAYEPGERDYAEEEAARLNRDSLKKLRRSTR